MTFQMGRRAFVGVGGGALISCVPQVAMAKTVVPEGTLLSQEQIAFAAAVDAAWRASKSEPDAAARAKILAQRGGEMRSALGEGLNFQNWRCTLTYIASLKETTLVAIHVLGSKGRARATIGNFSFADGSDVRLDPTSPLAHQARELRLEEQVLASGSFKPDSLRGCAGAYGKKASTSEAEFEIPLFTVRFTSLAPCARKDGTARDTQQAITPLPKRDEG
jgi:hypothetical protein